MTASIDQSAQPSQTAQSDLEEIIPARKSIPLHDGKACEISLFRIGRLPAITKALQPFMHFFELKQMPNLVLLLLTQPEDLLELLAALLDQPRSVVDQLPADDVVKLLTSYMEVNIDFLLQRVLPLLPQILAVMKNMKDQLAAAQGAIAGPKKSNP